MRHAVVLLVVLGCSSAPARVEPAAASQPPPSVSAATAAQPAAATLPRPSAPASGTTSPGYSCFSYVSSNSTVRRHACMRSNDCAGYLEQAKAVGGIRELSGCAAVPAVYCFHQVGTTEEPDGLEVCQPTLGECNAARADVVRAKMAVDTDCAASS